MVIGRFPHGGIFAVVHAVVFAVAFGASEPVHGEPGRGERLAGAGVARRAASSWITAMLPTSVLSAASRDRPMLVIARAVRCRIIVSESARICVFTTSEDSWWRAASVAANKRKVRDRARNLHIYSRISE